MASVSDSICIDASHIRNWMYEYAHWWKWNPLQCIVIVRKRNPTSWLNTHLCNQLQNLDPFQYKNRLSQVWDSHVKDNTVMRPSCLIHQGVRDKRRVSEIDLSQPMHDTAFWWRHNGPVTSQLADQIKWSDYPFGLIGIYGHVKTHNKESLTQRCRRATNVQMCLIYLYTSIWFESKWMTCLILHHK